MERHAEQSAVPEVVNVPIQVGEDVRCLIGQGVEDLDYAALFRDEDPTIAAEPDHRWVGQPAQNNGFLKPGRKNWHRMRQPGVRSGHGCPNYQHQEAQKYGVQPPAGPAERR